MIFNHVSPLPHLKLRKDAISSGRLLFCLWHSLLSSIDSANAIYLLRKASSDKCYSALFTLAILSISTMFLQTKSCCQGLQCFEQEMIQSIIITSIRSVFDTIPLSAILCGWSIDAFVTLAATPSAVVSNRNSWVFMLSTTDLVLWNGVPADGF